jgi:hypothetical protein
MKTNASKRSLQMKDNETAIIDAVALLLPTHASQPPQAATAGSCC